VNGMRLIWRNLLWGLLICLSLVWPAEAQASVVYHARLSGTVEGGMAAFVERVCREAEENRADLLLLEIDTYGGRIDSAIAIKERILACQVPTASFVSGKAISAGALIALAGEKVVMAPGTTIGAAEPRLGEEKADEKIVSMWSKELASTAEARGRDGQIAAAMADADIAIPDLVEKGKLLTLSRDQALQYGMADGGAASRSEALTFLGYPDAQVVELVPSTAETISGWVTHPYVAPILLTVGIVGILLEIFTVGFGLAGTVGLLAFALFFGGHILAGFSGWWAVLLFLLGIILLLVEALLLPGFGFAGAGGIAAVLASIVLASSSMEQALYSLVAALLASTVLLALSFRFLKTRRLWQRLILGDRQDNSQGYVAQAGDLGRFLDRTGTAVSPLRPAGVAEIDGERVDVVTEGDFILAGSPVRVVQVEGVRVVVKKID